MFYDEETGRRSPQFLLQVVIPGTKRNIEPLGRQGGKIFRGGSRRKGRRESTLSESVAFIFGRRGFYELGKDGGGSGGGKGPRDRW